MSIQLITEIDGITVNEILKDDITIYDYIKNVHISYRDLKREQLFRKKDKNYLDTLLKKLRDKGFDGIVMIEFVSGCSEKNLLSDTEILKSY